MNDTPTAKIIQHVCYSDRIFGFGFPFSLVNFFGIAINFIQYQAHVLPLVS